MQQDGLSISSTPPQFGSYVVDFGVSSIARLLRLHMRVYILLCAWRVRTSVCQLLLLELVECMGEVVVVKSLFVNQIYANPRLSVVGLTCQSTYKLLAKREPANPSPTYHTI